MVNINNNDYLISLFDSGGDDEIIIKNIELKYIYDLNEKCYFIGTYIYVYIYIINDNKKKSN